MARLCTSISPLFLDITPPILPQPPFNFFLLLARPQPPYDHGPPPYDGLQNVDYCPHSSPNTSATLISTLMLFCSPFSIRHLWFRSPFHQRWASSDIVDHQVRLSSSWLTIWAPTSTTAAFAVGNLHHLANFSPPSQPFSSQPATRFCWLPPPWPSPLCPIDRHQREPFPLTRCHFLPMSTNGPIESIYSHLCPLPSLHLPARTHARCPPAL